MLHVFAQQVRRDRIILPLWIIGTALLLTVSAASVLAEYGDAEGRAQILAVALATPALLALRGIPNGDALGSSVHFQSFAFLAVTIGLMNIFLATRHGRTDEENGRRELVLAGPISRLTPPIATLVLGVLANGLFGVLAILGYLSAGLPVAGAVLSATALAMTGLVFLGIGMLAGEFTATSRAANAVGTIAVLGFYALRGAGDALGRPDFERLTLTPAWPSALSPIGWGQQTLAFTEDRWWPVAALTVVTVVTVAAALVVHQRREIGASLVSQRAGRATARPWLASPLGLAWRLQWPTLIVWAAGSAFFGLILGSLVTAVAGADFDSPQIQAILQSLGHTDQADAARQLIAALLTIVGAVSMAAGVQAVLRMRDEETDGRLEEVLAAPLSRVRWLLSFTLVAALTVIGVLAATGLAAGAGFLGVGDGDSAWLSLGQALVQIPAALTVVGGAALLVGVVPRLSVALGWALYVVVIVIGLFGDLLALPDGLERISPISSVPVLPDDDWSGTLVLGAIALILAGVAAAAMNRREVPA